MGLTKATVFLEKKTRVLKIHKQILVFQCVSLFFSKAPASVYDQRPVFPARSPAAERGKRLEGVEDGEGMGESMEVRIVFFP